MSIARAVGARSARVQRQWSPAQLLAVDSGTNQAQVSIDGGSAVWLPMLASNYDTATVVAVGFDPLVGPLVLGPIGTQLEPPPAPAPAPAPDEASTVTDTAVIRPTWSGTWRVIRSAWDRWNVDRYGGRSTLWQGSGYGSGTLVGLATYGSQIVNLRALSIESVRVNIVRAYGSGTVVLQGSPHGSQPSGAPSSSGSTASGSDDIALPSDVREGMRTGSVKGLALVGSTYLAVRGTSSASGMSLSITYTRRA